MSQLSQQVYRTKMSDVALGKFAKDRKQWLWRAYRTRKFSREKIIEFLQDNYSSVFLYDSSHRAVPEDVDPAMFVGTEKDEGGAFMIVPDKESPGSYFALHYTSNMKMRSTSQRIRMEWF